MPQTRFTRRGTRLGRIDKLDARFVVPFLLSADSTIGLMSSFWQILYYLKNIVLVWTSGPLQT